MNIKEYLRSLYAEPVPEWLAAWRVGDVTPLHDFLQSRMVFYPGAGLDGHAVATFGGSGAAHCFLYADNLVGEEALERDLDLHGFKGYSELASFRVESQIVGELKNQFEYLTAEEKRRGLETLNRHGGGRSRPFWKLYIFERRVGLDEQHGPARIALLYAQMDAFAVYEALFANRNATLWGMLLQDHGFGCNYDRFGRGGIMERIAERSGVYPQVMLVGDNTSEWAGYEKVECVDAMCGGMGSHARRVFERKAY